MTSEPRRDPVTDPLLTPENSALIVIDYQPNQLQAVGSIDHDLHTRNIVAVARLARTFGLPTVLSTVNVHSNGAPPTLPGLEEVLAGAVEIDRTSINAWEDVEFRHAVQATERRKLIMTALWTEMCPWPASSSATGPAPPPPSTWSASSAAPHGRQPTPPSHNKSRGERCQR
jgi:nicotinamidase-related amidase